MRPYEAFEGSIRSGATFDRVEAFGRLRQAVVNFVSQGHDRSELQRDLHSLVEALRSAGREQEEEVVLDVLDLLAGWCSPEFKI